MARYFVNSKDDKIVREDICSLRLEKSDGEVISDLQPKRLFPFSRPNEYISLFDGKSEAAVITDLRMLDSESRTAVEECFEEFYMIPKITGVIDTMVKFGTFIWIVETDRGRITIRIRNMGSDIKMLDENRMLIRDSNDNRYEIPDISKLDKNSLKKLFAFT